MSKSKIINELAECVKDNTGTVISQDEMCKQFCGDLHGEQCKKGCMDSYAKLSQTEKIKDGFHFFEKRKIDGENFDILLVKKENLLVSLLHPSKSLEQPKAEELNNLLVEKNLTRREREIFDLRLIQGLTLKEICNKINISRATLRTHINNINKKI